jgi:cytochrome c nitrite reductase small subunit
MSRVPAIIAAVLGIALGVGLYTFVYARGYSYLSNDPKACANCHIMNEQFDGWQKGSHKSVATCNDCHTPPAFIPKYLTKAQNGFFHSLYFTTQKFHEPIQITPRNRRVTEQACRKCHQEIVAAIESADSGSPHAGDNQTACLKCHFNVGHMELTSVGSNQIRKETLLP